MPKARSKHTAWYCSLADMKELDIMFVIVREVNELTYIMYKKDEIAYRSVVKSII